MTDETPTFTVEEIFTDRLEEMLRLQNELQKKYNRGIFPADLPDDRAVEFIRVMVLAAEDELHEALRETPWKPWSKSHGWTREQHDRYQDELVDVFHFFMNLMLVADMSAEELFKRYLRKNGINHDREDNGYVSPTG